MASDADDRGPGPDAAREATTDRDPPGSHPTDPAAFGTGPTAMVGSGASQPAPLVPGMVLSDTYRLEARLGEGGMGEVWRAAHLRLPKAVAIKVLLPGVDTSGEALERFVREAEIGATLAHPNIVHVFDFNTLEDGRRYIAMELLEGESLAERLERGPMAPEEVAAALRQAAVGLRVAHEAGVVHRDLKPDNLFLAADPSSTPPWRVKVLDFGISKIKRADTTLTRDMTVMGTPAYMAPEQAMGRTKSLGPEADQFALATIAYEMLTGEVAFRGNTLAEIVYRVVQETPPPVDTVRPGVPPGCARAIERAMSKDPDARFPDVTAFVDALVRATEGGADAAGAPGPGTAPGTAVSPTAAGAGAEPAAPRAEAAPSTAPAAGAGRRWAIWAGAAGVVGATVAIAGALGGGGAGSNAGDPGPAAAAPAPGAADPVAATAPGGGASGDDAAPGAAGPTPEAPADRVGGGDGATTAAGDGEGTGAAADGRDGVGARADLDERAAAETGGEARARARGGRPAARLEPETRALLDQANEALAAGDGRRAMRLAERAYRAERNRPALELMAKAACVQRDLGLANARLARLPGNARRRVARWCRANGLDVAR